MMTLVWNLAAQRPKDRPAPAPKGSGPKGSGPKAPKAQIAPGAPARKKGGEWTAVDRFNRMTPEQRQKALDRLPPERRQKLEQRLDQYNHLTPEMRSRLRAFDQLPPEKQNQARRLFRQFGELPPERQAPLRKEFENLRGMSDADRRARMNSDEFRSTYNSHEQRMLGDLSGMLNQ